MGCQALPLDPPSRVFAHDGIATEEVKTPAGGPLEGVRGVSYHPPTASTFLWTASKLDFWPGTGSPTEEILYSSGGSISGVEGLARGNGANEIGVFLVWTDERLLRCRHLPRGRRRGRDAPPLEGGPVRGVRQGLLRRSSDDPLGVGIASGVDRFFALGGDVALLGLEQLLPSAVATRLSSTLQKTEVDTAAISASPCLLGRVFPASDTWARSFYGGFRPRKGSPTTR